MTEKFRAIVGKRKIMEVQLTPDSNLFSECVSQNFLFNNVFPNSINIYRKGIYRFKNHGEANIHQENALVDNIVNTSLQRVKNGK